ncbi:hypothetical protein PT974_00729 [Cladobotryum mycophilum]|uniref:Uncharacterized protein n=1 Tax=Cladobotryum mycophilum TaxID=491253 RepID=A0ABR0T1R0_9HYPO
MDLFSDPNTFITFLAGPDSRPFRMSKSSIRSLSAPLKDLIDTSPKNTIDWSDVEYDTFLGLYRYACCHDYTFANPSWAANDQDDSPEAMSPVSSCQSGSSVPVSSLVGEFNNNSNFLDSDDETTYDDASSLPSSTGLGSSRWVFRHTARLYALALKWSVRDLCALMLQRLDRLFGNILQNNVSLGDHMVDLLDMVRVVYKGTQKADPARTLIARFFVRVLDEAAEHSEFVGLTDKVLEFRDDLVQVKGKVLQAQGDEMDMS